MMTASRISFRAGLRPRHHSTKTTAGTTGTEPRRTIARNASHASRLRRSGAMSMPVSNVNITQRGIPYLSKSFSAARSFDSRSANSAARRDAQMHLPSRHAGGAGGAHGGMITLQPASVNALHSFALTSESAFSTAACPDLATVVEH